MKATVISAALGVSILFQQAALAETTHRQQPFDYRGWVNGVIENAVGKDPLQQELFVSVYNRDLERTKIALSYGAKPNFVVLQKQ